jgi:hypothetical protein
MGSHSSHVTEADRLAIPALLHLSDKADLIRRSRTMVAVEATHAWTLAE